MPIPYSHYSAAKGADCDYFKSAYYHHKTKYYCGALKDISPHNAYTSNRHFQIKEELTKREGKSDMPFRTYSLLKLTYQFYV